LIVKETAFFAKELLKSETSRVALYEMVDWAEQLEMWNV